VSIEAYPLCWPAGWKRLTDNIYRDRARFGTSLAKARDELFRELELMGASQIILSTNIPTRRDGLPYAGMAQPKDPGAAVYFVKGRGESKRQMVFACDRWQKVEDNVQAIRLSVAALRGLERWGASDMLERAFTGFTALPAPEELAEDWWRVLGVAPNASAAEIKAARNALARRFHPDNGSEPNAARMASVNRAYEDVANRGLV
jgi:hypothetical protein